MSCTTLTVPDMDKPPSKYEVIVRVAKDDGHPPDPAAFTVAASTAASLRNASVVSAHMVEEAICVVGVGAPDRPAAVAVALAVAAAALRVGIRSRHPAGERPVPAVVRRLEEHRLPELVVAAVAHDPDVSHAAPGRFPGRCADARRPTHLRLLARAARRRPRGHAGDRHLPCRGAPCHGGMRWLAT